MIELSFREKIVALAFWMEAEGSFYANRSGGLRVQSGQAQKEPLERLHQWFGGSLHSVRYQGNSREHWMWVVSSTKAAGLSMMVFPLMSLRRKAQIRKALGLWLSTSPASRYRTHCPEGHSDWVVRKQRSGRERRECRQCQADGHSSRYYRNKVRLLSEQQGVK